VPTATEVGQRIDDDDESCQGVSGWENNFHLQPTIDILILMAATTTDNPFTVWLAEALRERGWNNADLARQARIGPSTISQWFTVGQLPRGQQQEKLAAALGVDRDFIPHLVALSKGEQLEGAIAEPPIVCTTKNAVAEGILPEVAAELAKLPPHVQALVLDLLPIVKRIAAKGE